MFLVMFVNGVIKTVKFHCRPVLLNAGPRLDALMEQLRTELANNPPLPGSYSPKKGELCAAKFGDGEW